MLVFSVFFGALARVPSEGAPYPIFVYSGLLVWLYFANALTQASNSLVQYERLITKVYFPRLIVPMAPIVAGLVDFAIAFTVLIALLRFYRIAPTSAIWTLPLFVLLAMATALAVALWLSALNVRYRDVRHVVPFLIQVWFFSTPVLYSSTLVPEQWRAVYGLNPMAGVVDGFRWALLGRAQPPGVLLAVSVVMVAALLVGGLYYFRRMERTFVDVV